MGDAQNHYMIWRTNSHKDKIRLDYRQKRCIEERSLNQNEFFKPAPATLGTYLAPALILGAGPRENSGMFM